jgi:hypothetical protein
MRPFAPLLPLSLLCLPTLAQEVTLRGKVEDVQGTPNQFVIDCTNTALSSTLFDLNLFVGQSVELSGTWSGSPTAPAVQVTQIQAIPETYEIGGGAKLGELSVQGFTAAPGTAVLGLLSLQPGFLPLPGSGTVLIDLGQTVLQASGVIGGSGVLELPFLIPNNPNLLGLDFYGQGALIAGGNVTLTNPDCKTVDN